MVFFMGSGQVTHTVFHRSHFTFHCPCLSGRKLQSWLIFLSHFRLLQKLPVCPLYCQQDFLILPSTPDAERKTDLPVAFPGKQGQQFLNMLVSDVFLSGRQLLHFFIQEALTDHRMQRQKRLHSNTDHRVPAVPRLCGLSVTVRCPDTSASCFFCLQFQIVLRLRQQLRRLIHMRYTALYNILLRIRQNMMPNTISCVVILLIGGILAIDNSSLL